MNNGILQAGERRGIVMDVDHFAVHDGPGIRTCVYLKGCPLSCAWCHSPESQSFDPQLFFAQSRCTGCRRCAVVCPEGVHRQEGSLHILKREHCSGCGTCARACPTGALSVSGRFMTVDETVSEALADRVFYENSGGGVTLSGGEVLSQAVFAREVLSHLKSEGIHTLVETSGFGREEALLSLAEVTDLFYFDFKLADFSMFRRFTGGDPEVVMRNLISLRAVTDHIVLRIPLIPGITDTVENVSAGFALACDMGIHSVHLLPYNASAGAKYAWMGREYPLDLLEARQGLHAELFALAPPELDVEIMT